jgi:hypothetical protein
MKHVVGMGVLVDFGAVDDLLVIDHARRDDDKDLLDKTRGMP